MSRSLRRALVCLAAWVVAGFSLAEEGRALPEPAKLPWIEASIRAMEDNGVAGRVARELGVDLPDGTRALPIKHVIDCESESACTRVARWANRAGLTPSKTLIDYGHGGVAQYGIHLRQRVPLTSKRVHAEASRIHEALERLPGTRYDTWMLDLDPKVRAVLDNLRLSWITLASVALVWAATPSETVLADTVPDRGLVNYETPHVHPLDLTPDRATLLAVNTALHTLEVFDVSGGLVVQVATIPVGLDPVSVRARDNNQAWVVNHISDSVSIVDLDQRTVVATLQTDNEPADVVFAAGRAFVSCSEANNLNVFDLADTGDAPLRVAIHGEDPRALAVSADGKTVFAAIFESGNGTTAVSRLRTQRPESPYGGQVPVPNAGSDLDPPINPDLTASPATAIIVRKDGLGRWMDDNGGDWSVFISGPLSSRASGWDLLDHDVARIDSQSLEVTYQGGTLNAVMALDTHPVSGHVSLVGTEALNEVRFEPNLNGKFLRVRLASFDTAGSANIRDLNPHLDYTTASVAAPLRTQSIGDPRGIAWEAGGNRAWITGMGSNNVVVVDDAGNRVAHIGVGQGPTGIVLDSDAGRGYVLNKFSGSVSVLDLTALQQTLEARFFDPTPEIIRAGRPVLYDTHLSSGPGHVACASCHIDGRTDRLAWDLGDPSGTEVIMPIAGADGELNGATIVLSPIKGPLVTQTLQDIASMQALHWRGDREGLDAFNPSFVSLLGADQQLTPEQMQAFAGFLGTIHLPPNPYRNLDNTRPSSVTLPDGATMTTSSHLGLRGENSNGNDCMGCHMNGRPRNEFVNRELGQAFIPPALAGFYDRLGFWPDLQDGSTSGFGFFHDGVGSARVASRVTTAEEQEDMLAEIMTLEGPAGLLVGNERRQDTHAGVGRQLTVSGVPAGDDSALLNQMLTIANDSPYASLIARGKIGGQPRGLVLIGGETFQSDRAGETFELSELLTASAILVYADDFEAAGGWTTNPDGDDTAYVGQWEVGHPGSMNYRGGPYQRDDTTSGTQALVTGAAAGVENDVDGGVTSARSPSIVLPPGRPALTFAYYLAHRSDATEEDYLRVTVEGDVLSRVVLEVRGAPKVTPGVWTQFVGDLSDFANQAVTLLFEAADEGLPSLIEAAVDDVTVGLAENPEPLTFTLVADGTEIRLGVDRDFDAVFDADDCAPSGPGVQSAPGAVGPTLRVDKAGSAIHLAWNPATQGHTTNVYRGSLGYPWTYDESCVAAEVTGETYDDTRVSPMDTAIYYIVAPRNACGDGRIGLNPDGSDRSPAVACPALGRDTDHDGVFDVADNCAGVPNADQVDTDSDSVGDACD